MSFGNTKFGDGALKNNKQGWNNAAFGTCSSRDTDVSWNTSVGAYANMSNVSGISNVCMGTNAHLFDISGSYNTALGTATLLNNTVNSNTAVGSNSMEWNTTGKENVAVGVQTGYANKTGEQNVFVGSYAGFNNVDGSQNIFLGYNSGIGSTINHNNIFIGCNTTNTYDHTNSTVIGNNADMLISNGIILGKEGDKILIPGEAYIHTTSDANKLITQEDLITYASVGIVLTDPCDCATIENVNLSDPPNTIDGVTLVDNMRVLVRCQGINEDNKSTSSIDNGIYVLSSGILERVDTVGDSVSGQSTFIKEGSLNKHVLFKQTANPAIVGTNELKYTPFWNLSLQLGNGLQMDGNEINVKSDLTDQNGNPFLQNVDILGTLHLGNRLTMNSSNNDLRQITSSYFNISKTSNTTLQTDDSRFFQIGGIMYMQNITGDTINLGFNPGITCFEVKKTICNFYTDVNLNGLRTGRGNNNNNTNTVFGLNSGINLNGISDTNGGNNVFIGRTTGQNTTSGYHNIFLGSNSGTSNTSGSGNTFIGQNSGNRNITCNDNVFIGQGSGQSILADGSNKNTFVGNQSGVHLNRGIGNTFLGYMSSAGIENIDHNSSYNTTIGYRSGMNSTNTFNNVLIGANTDVSGNVNNSVALGYNVVVDTSNTIIIGTNSQITKIPGELIVNNMDVDGTLTVEALIAEEINVFEDARFNKNATIVGTLSAGDLNVGSGGIDCSGNLNLFDYATSPTNSLFSMSRPDNNNRIEFVLNPGTGAYNGITRANDNLLVAGGSRNLVIAPHSFSAITNGIRMTETSCMMGSGGNANLPAHRLDISSNQFLITSSNFRVDGDINVNGNINMVAAASDKRQITGSFFNVRDIIANSVGLQLYQNDQTTIFDNNAPIGGTFVFACNDSIGNQITPFQFNTSTMTITENNLTLTTVNPPTCSAVQPAFTDNSTKIPTTAWVQGAINLASSTATVTYTTNQSVVIPDGTRFIDILCMGRGGIAGVMVEPVPGTFIYGGTGSGGNCVWASGIPMSAGETLDLSFVFSDNIFQDVYPNNNTGYSQVTYLGNTNPPLCRAYNGNNGEYSGALQGANPNTRDGGGIVDTTFGLWSIALGTAGVQAPLTIPNTIPTIGVNQSCPKGTSIWVEGKNGCGQQYKTETSGSGLTGPGIIVITFHKE